MKIHIAGIKNITNFAIVSITTGHNFLFFQRLWIYL